MKTIIMVSTARPCHPACIYIYIYSVTKKYIYILLGSPSKWVEDTKLSYFRPKNLFIYIYFVLGINKKKFDQQK